MKAAADIPTPSRDALIIMDDMDYFKVQGVNSRVSQLSATTCRRFPGRRRGKGNHRLGNRCYMLAICRMLLYYFNNSARHYAATPPYPGQSRLHRAQVARQIDIKGIRDGLLIRVNDHPDLSLIHI